MNSGTLGYSPPPRGDRPWVYFTRIVKPGGDYTDPLIADYRLYIFRQDRMAGVTEVWTGLTWLTAIEGAAAPEGYAIPYEAIDSFIAATEGLTR